MPWKRKSWDPQTDKGWGPFTYNGRGSYRAIGVTLYSPGDESESGKAGLRLNLGRHCLILALPQWVCPPKLTKVYPESWGPEVVERLGRNWYHDHKSREFGVTLNGGERNGYDYLIVRYGVHTHSSDTDKSWGWFLPWKQWRMVRHTFYGLNPEMVAYESPQPGPKWDTPEYELDRQARDAVPTRIFAFLDYDGEHLYATTKIEEREWRKGEGWWRWVGRFAKPLVRRSLDIRFSGETGQRKGSYKGGTIGTGIELQPGEHHVGGFMRYCEVNGMRFLFEVDAIPPAMDPANNLKPCPTELPHLCCWPSCTCAKEREPDNQG